MATLAPSDATGKLTLTIWQRKALAFARSHGIPAAAPLADGSISIYIWWTHQDGRTGLHRDVCRTGSEVRASLGY